MKTITKTPVSVRSSFAIPSLEVWAEHVKRLRKDTQNVASALVDMFEARYSSAMPDEKMVLNLTELLAAFCITTNFCRVQFDAKNKVEKMLAKHQLWYHVEFTNPDGRTWLATFTASPFMQAVHDDVRTMRTSDKA